MMSRIPIILTITRGFRHKGPRKEWKPEGVKYGLITYYPRHPDHKDPPITPSKLLMVSRVKPFKGQPYWHKAALRQIGFDEDDKKDNPVIVKNTPDMCHLLWSIKHLVKINPIKLPENLSEFNENSGAYLHENGTFHVIPKLDERRLEATRKFMTDSKRLDTATVKEKLRLKWLNGYEC